MNIELHLVSKHITYLGTMGEIGEEGIRGIRYLRKVSKAPKNISVALIESIFF